MAIDANPFEGPRLKIERAKQHIIDFHACREAFRVGPDLIRVIPETDAETGWLRTSIELTQPLPSDLRLTAADALYNLRSALDQAICRCVVLAGQSPDGTYFPHGKDRAGFEAALRTKCKKVPVLVRSAIAALEPYHGGNSYLLRVLHDLNLIDKHTDLLATGIFPTEAELRTGKGLLPVGEVWRRTEDGFEHLAGAIEVNHQMEITLAVTFLGVQAVENEPASKVLAQLCNLVIHTIDIIEDVLRHTLD